MKMPLIACFVLVSLSRGSAVADEARRSGRERAYLGVGAGAAIDDHESVLLGLGEGGSRSKAA